MIEDFYKARLMAMLDECEAFSNRSAEIHNLLACISEARYSLRCAIELQQRITDLEKNPESGGKHDLMEEMREVEVIGNEDDLDPELDPWDPGIVY